MPEGRRLVIDSASEACSVALIDGGPRSAAAIAAEPTEALSLDKPTFLALIREKPEFALHVMRVMAHRLRKMNEQL